jgi:riboflavin kinase/FMN adenylyltransferase
LAPNKNVVTIGVFDGVHAGHRALIAQAREIADDLNATLTVASFDPHPASVLRPEAFLGLLTVPERRTELLLELGVDRVEYLSFDENMRTMNSSLFVEDVLVNQLGADVILVGTNFRFGNKAEGDIDTLRDLARKFGFTVITVDLAGDDTAWSSTRIRNLIVDSQVAKAAELLGRHHRLSGVVVHGDHRGRELGYPTANLQVDDSLIIPADGVYSALMSWNGQQLPAAVSIGTNPTFDGVVGRRVEAYVIDEIGLDLYGQRIYLDSVSYTHLRAHETG